jgi:elongation factor Ts
MSITAAEVNELRQITGAGLMDCKQALTETNGDIDAAVDYLRKKGQKVSAKRADREANEGAVIAVTNSEGTRGAVIHLTSETDFVAKNEDFVAFARSIAELALDQNPADLEGLLALDMGGASVGDKVTDQVAKIGEKIEVKSYESLEGNGVVAYIHAGNKIGVLVSLNKSVSGDAEQVSRDAAMQIAAMSPVAVNRDGVDQDTIDREFFKENTLVDQVSVKDSSKTVGQTLSDIDGELEVVDFKRVAIGG